MTQLDQEIPKIKGSTILSTLDITSGFWMIPVHPDDQHKLAFTFGNRHYTFTRCPFGYANSPAEFNTFLNKACPDARVRGNLVYVDGVLMKSSSVEDHLKEIDHVLNQLTTAGAKIALHKGQWCKTKVNYVGLLVGRNGIEPQSNRAQAIQSIKTPTNVSELRSFLGVCNYSRQFIENYADIARPLTSLLKKDGPFVWMKAQDTAMSQLKQCLCSAPCLAYPDPGKELYLDAGFSDQCLSAGLYQLHDKDKRVVAYASKTLLPPECKYSHCEKALEIPPFRMMTGRNMTLPLHLLYQPGDLNLITAYNTHQYLEELHQHLRTTFAFAQQQLQRSAEGRKAYYDQKASHHELNVGDQVWYYSFARPRPNAPHHLSKKFLPHWTGPHEIVDKLSPVAYRIKIRQGRSEPVLRWVHRNQIKRPLSSSRHGKGED